MGEKNRRPRRRLALAGVAVLVVVAILALTATLFVWPSTNVPRRSDAIVVLGGSGLRVQKGVALAHAGYAPNLVVSDPDRSTCPTLHRQVTVICFNPDPATTQGEARFVARLAGTRHRRQIIVVSGTP